MGRPERAEDGRPEGKVIRLPGAANDSGPGRFGDRDQADRWAPYAETGSPVANGFDSIAQADPSFDPHEFAEGAKAAYEMIIGSFAAGDRQSLRELLAKDVFDSFAAAIDDRESRGETVETTFVSLDKIEYVDVQMRGKTAHVSVKFQSKLISATRDRNGTVIEGSSERIVDMIDIWTFARDVTSRDPNWRLVATEAGA